MRAKQCSTAIGKYSSFETFTPPTTSDAGGSSAVRTKGLPDGPCCGSPTCPAAAQGEGLLHDARNLVGAIGLYCDLLSMPGVLKPEHRQYPEELRLLGERSRALIDSMMGSLLELEKRKGICPGAGARVAGPVTQRAETVERPVPGTAEKTVMPVSVRQVVERCSGMLRGVANGCALAIEYGPAAAAPVRVAEEAVERMLANLVRNAAAALGPDRSSGTIRITLGMLDTRVGEPRPWPFRRLRLSVEDSGCGMDSEQVELLLHGQESSGDSHGIGFRIVRELAAASDAKVQVMSEVGTGTRVQIEWPVAAMSAAELLEQEPVEFMGRPVKTLPAECRSRRLGDARNQPEMEGAC